MSDESPRSTQGRSSDRRPGSGAPLWWGQLDRSDLPDDSGRRPAPRPVEWVSHSTPPLVVLEEERAGGPRLHSWVATLLVVLVSLAILVVGLGALSARGLVVAALLFGVPVLLCTVAVRVVTGRIRH